MSSMKNVIPVILLAFLISSGSSVFAQVKADTLKVLFVGNSYTYYGNLAQVISIISDNTKTKLITKKSTLGGAKLSEHWRGERGLTTKEMIKSGKYDIVVLQDYSLGPVEVPDSVKKYMGLFCKLIRQTGAKPYLYLTWARVKSPQTQEVINKVYTETGIENEAVVVPAGKAWTLARAIQPDINLYDTDGSHPSKIGTFLTACVFIESITREIPEKMPTNYVTNDVDGESVVLMKIDKDDVEFCRKVAKQIVN